MESVCDGANDMSTYLLQVAWLVKEHVTHAGRGLRVGKQFEKVGNESVGDFLGKKLN